jgi:hypothetical protein
MGYYSSFVVKIWVDENEGVSRGYVQHVGTQEAVYFLTLDKMVNFIMNHLGPPPSHDVKSEEGISLSVLAQDERGPSE